MSATTTARVVAGPLSPEDVSDRLGAIAETYARPDTAGVAVLDGFGCNVRVERGALELTDGIGPHRRVRRYDRATHGLSRLVVTNADGVLSLAALRWCHALGIAVYVLGADGRPQLTSAPRLTDDARVRRAQALAPDEPVGLAITRELLGAKLRGQAKLAADRLGDDETAGTILDLAEALDSLSSIDVPFSIDDEGRQLVEQARQLEASAAALYFGAWAGRPETSPVFVARDRARVPAHWCTFETRRSVLASASSNRRAERPLNAMLNYCFALLESEAILACHAVGLDPGLGIVHADARSRASMALDLIEPVRPEVERFVLDLLGTRTFRKADFVALPDGGCRVAAPLTHELAESLPRWRAAVAPWAEKVAHLLGEQLDGKYVAHTPLTSARTKAAQAAVKARKGAVADLAATARRQALQRSEGSPVRRQQPAPGPVSLPLGCLDCGQLVTSPRRVLCDDCLAATPGQAPEVRSRRGRAIASRKRALTERGDAGLPAGCDEAWYRSEVLPRLGAFKLAEIMDASGYSKGHCSTLRAGKWLPHVSTWGALATLVAVELPIAILTAEA